VKINQEEMEAESITELLTKPPEIYKLGKRATEQTITNNINQRIRE